MDLIVEFAPKILTLCALNILLVTAMVFVFRDYKKAKAGEEGESLEVASDARGELPERPNILMALAPELPIIILFLFPELILNRSQKNFSTAWARAMPTSWASSSRPAALQVVFVRQA